MFNVRRIIKSKKKLFYFIKNHTQKKKSQKNKTTNSTLNISIFKILTNKKNTKHRN